MDFSNLKLKLSKQKESFKAKQQNNITQSNTVIIANIKKEENKQNSIENMTLKIEELKEYNKKMKESREKEKQINRLKLKEEVREWKNTFDLKLFLNSLIFQSNKERENELKKMQGEIINNNVLDKELKDNSLINFNDLSLEYQSNEIVIWINYLLDIWKKEIKEYKKNNKEDKETIRKISIFIQCKKFITPLISQLSANQIESDIVRKLFQIVVYTLNRSYVNSNKIYYKLAIGNSPWPKGKNGIDIYSQKNNLEVAHIMTDDETRKFIISIKRLITLSQRLFPNKTLGSN